MSETVAYTGTLTPVVTGELTNLEWLQENHPTGNKYDTAKKYIEEEELDDSLIIIKDTLYRIEKSKEHPEDLSFFVSKPDGSIDFACVFYNGATYLGEVLEEGLG